MNLFYFMYKINFFVVFFILALLISTSSAQWMHPSAPTIKPDFSIQTPNLCYLGEKLNLSFTLEPVQSYSHDSEFSWKMPLSSFAASENNSLPCVSLNHEKHGWSLEFPALLYQGYPLGLSLSMALSDMDSELAYWKLDSTRKTVPALYLTFDPDDLDHLYSRDPASNERVPATARFEDSDQEIALDGVRFRGSSTRVLPKKSFNIRFDNPQVFLFGSSRMNANAMYTDPAMMRERLAWTMFAELKRPASRTKYLDIWLNNIYEGLYIHIERVDGDLLQNHGLNPDGTLVRDGFRDDRNTPNSAFGFALSTIPEDEREKFIAERFGSRGTPNWEELVDLILWVEGSIPGEKFAREFEQRFDKEIFIDWLAVHFLIGDYDSWGDDYWLYLDHYVTDSRWIVIPWDKDLSFGSHWRPDYELENDYFQYMQPVSSGWDNNLIDLFLSTEPLIKELQDRMRFLLQKVFHQDFFLNNIIENWNTIGESIIRQPTETGIKPIFFEKQPGNHFSYQNAPFMHMETLTDFIELRYAFLNNWLEPGNDEKYFSRHHFESLHDDDIILFTDSQGWTIARMQVLNAPEGPGNILFAVSEDSSLKGIDRVWKVYSDFPGFDARLSLFYRNEMAVLQTGNWYTQGEEAVGEQFELVMAQRIEQDIALLPDSRVNPFSNKVEATVSINPDSIQEFVVILPDPDSK